jgi:molecular chaperone GrpE
MVDQVNDADPPRAAAPEVKVVDRRWWARGEHAEAESDSAAAGKPAYVQELEQRLAEKDRRLQEYIEQYKAATAEFEAARARARREVGREVQRGTRAMLVELLEVLDNLDRAIDAAREGTSLEALLHGVGMVRQQFMTRLEAGGIREIPALDQQFDPARHEAVSVVPVATAADEDRVLGVVRRGYLAGDEVLRPALVAVGRKAEAG